MRVSFVCLGLTSVLSPVLVAAQAIPPPPPTTSRASMAYGDERGCRRGDMTACANLGRL